MQAFPGDGSGVNPPTEPSLIKDFLIFQIILSCRQVGISASEKPGDQLIEGKPTILI